MIVRSPSSISSCEAVSGFSGEDFAQIDAITFVLEEPAVGTYRFYMPFGGTIVETVVKTSSGSGTVTTAIDGVAVTGLGGVAADSTQRKYTSTAANEFAIGQYIHFTVATNLSMLYLEVTIVYRRNYE